MDRQASPLRNRLLAALPASVMSALQPKLRPVPLPLRESIYKQDGVMDSVYFAESGMFSLVANLEDGMRAEVGIVGNEGMLGIGLMYGIDTPYVECLVQMPGSALSMTARDFRQEIDANPPFRDVIARYAESLSAQVMQTAACNGHHGLEQRLARWLLMAHDRADGDELPLTQEFIAMMLGVHRPSITVTAGILHRAGLIRYASGRVTIVDRSSLEAAACECYTIVQRRYTMLMSAVTP